MSQDEKKSGNRNRGAIYCEDESDDDREPQISKPRKRNKKLDVDSYEDESDDARLLQDTNPMKRNPIQISKGVLTSREDKASDQENVDDKGSKNDLFYKRAKENPIKEERDSEYDERVTEIKSFLQRNRPTEVEDFEELESSMKIRGGTKHPHGKPGKIRLYFDEQSESDSSGSTKEKQARTLEMDKRNEYKKKHTDHLTKRKGMFSLGNSESDSDSDNHHSRDVDEREITYIARKSRKDKPQKKNGDKEEESHSESSTSSTEKENSKDSYERHAPRRKRKVKVIDRDSNNYNRQETKANNGEDFKKQMDIIDRSTQREELEEDSSDCKRSGIEKNYRSRSSYADTKKNKGHSYRENEMGKPRNMMQRNINSDSDIAELQENSGTPRRKSVREGKYDSESKGNCSQKSRRAEETELIQTRYEKVGFDKNSKEEHNARNSREIHHTRRENRSSYESESGDEMHTESRSQHSHFKPTKEDHRLYEDENKRDDRYMNKDAGVQVILHDNKYGKIRNQEYEHINAAESRKTDDYQHAHNISLESKMKGEYHRDYQRGQKPSQDNKMEGGYQRGRNFSPERRMTGDIQRDRDFSTEYQHEREFILENRMKVEYQQDYQRVREPSLESKMKGDYECGLEPVPESRMKDEYQHGWKQSQDSRMKGDYQRDKKRGQEPSPESRRKGDDQYKRGSSPERIMKADNRHGRDFSPERRMRSDDQLGRYYSPEEKRHSSRKEVVENHPTSKQREFPRNSGKQYGTDEIDGFQSNLIHRGIYEDETGGYDPRSDNRKFSNRRYGGSAQEMFQEYAQEARDGAHDGNKAYGSGRYSEEESMYMIRKPLVDEGAPSRKYQDDQNFSQNTMHKSSSESYFRDGMVTEARSFKQRNKSQNSDYSRDSYPDVSSSYLNKKRHGLSVTSLISILLQRNRYKTSIDKLMKIGLDPKEVWVVVHENSHIFAVVSNEVIKFRPEIKICSHHLHTGCPNKMYCSSLHICLDYIHFVCKKKDCIYGHNLISRHNLGVLEEYYLNDMPELEVLDFLKFLLPYQKVPQTLKVCSDHNGNKCNYSTCSDLHICLDYLINMSCNDRCKRSHDLLSKNNRRILENCGIDTNESPRDIIRCMQDDYPSIFNQQLPFAGSENRTKQKGIGNFGGKVQSRNASIIPDRSHVDLQSRNKSAKPIRNENYGFGVDRYQKKNVQPQNKSSPLEQNFSGSKSWKIPQNFTRNQNSDFGGTVGHDTVWCEYYQGNTEIPEICYYSVNGKCRFEEVGCKRLHSDRYYHWQVKQKGKGWINLRKNQVDSLERSYCDPLQDKTQVPPVDPNNCPREILTFFGRDNWDAYFPAMIFHNAKTQVTLELRRIVSENIDGNVKCAWNLWYFLDQNNTWVQYGNVDTTKRDFLVSSISSNNIEKQYRSNSSSSVTFKNSVFTYILDFNSMTQINTSTNVTRKVKRRPVPHIKPKSTWPFNILNRS